jgi:hypothetical protein
MLKVDWLGWRLEAQKRQVGRMRSSVFTLEELAIAH